MSTPSSRTLGLLDSPRRASTFARTHRHRPGVFVLGSRSRSARQRSTTSNASGDIAVGLDDLDAALAQLAEQGIDPEKPPYPVSEGGSFICFLQDPDS